MIVKIKSHKRAVFRKVLEYMLNNKDRLYDKQGKSFVITHNLKGNTVEEWEVQYRLNETYRLRKRSNSVILTHEILSWHRDDARHITLAKLEVLAIEYIKLRNPKGIYVATPHFDKDHYHIHILASGIEYRTGKTLRLSKSEMQKLKKDIQQYQVEHFPELSKSIVEHGKKEKSFTSDKEYQVKLRTGMETEKEQVLSILKACYKKAVSKDTFYELLNDSGIKTYERGGKISGVVLGNYKFRFKRLGFSEEKIEELNKTIGRNKDLRKSRERDKNITQKRNSRNSANRLR
jgi:hypothetical protein